MYDNRARVPGFAAHVQRWIDESARARREQRCELDLAYGDGASETLDVFPAPHGGKPAPVLVFIHGGYWRSMDKRDHSFIAGAFARRGVCSLVLNHALCPAVTIPDITMQMVRALAWTWHNVERWGGDRARITVAGHSAGGHLAAMLAACLWDRFEPDLPEALVRNALAISGLYDLEPLMHTPLLQGDLRLTGQQVRKASPARLPPPARGAIYAVAGGDESAEFLRQNRLIQQAWGPQRVPVCETLPGLNHFSVLEALAEPGHALQQRALELLEV